MSRIDELEGRVKLVEERLGIDTQAIAADEAESLERGAEQNDLTEGVLESPGGQDVSAQGLKTDALAKAASTDATNPEAVEQAVTHLDAALDAYPGDAELVAARDALVGEPA